MPLYSIESWNGTHCPNMQTDKIVLTAKRQATITLRTNRMALDMVAVSRCGEHPGKVSSNQSLITDPALVFVGLYTEIIENSFV